MKKAILITAIILLAVNLLLGVILTSYNWFNVTVTSGVIVLTVILSLLAVGSTMKDGFKAGLLLFCSVVGLIQLCLGAFMQAQFSDNWCLIAIIILLAIETVLLMLCKQLSAKSDKQR